MPPASRGLGHKLGRAFLLQAGMISAAALLGVVAAGYIVTDLMIRRALADEAAYFWDRYAADPGAPRPDTRSMRGLLLPEDAALAAGLPELPPGFHKLEVADAGFTAVHVSEAHGRRLVIEFDGRRVSRLALFFGIAPLTGVLCVIYVAMWLTYRVSQRAVSPVIALAQRVAGLDPDVLAAGRVPELALDTDADAEVAALTRAINDLTARLGAFVARERDFTRDASHELRTPITVIKLAADLLAADAALPAAQRGAVDRIKRSAVDMEELIDALLLLAREGEQGLIAEDVAVNEVAAAEVERARLLLAGKPVAIELHEDARLVVRGSDKLLGVVLGNLIRNACSYTAAGCVTVHIDARGVTVRDSGVGIPPQQVSAVFKPFVRLQPGWRGGYGVGLAIVRKLTDRFGWPLQLSSAAGVGTTVRVEFPEARPGP